MGHPVYSLSILWAFGLDHVDWLISIQIVFQVEGSWYGWGAWGSCSSSCGMGTMTRSRGHSGSSPCSGSSVETTSCSSGSRCSRCKEDWSCCTASSPCLRGEGDCDSDSDCAGKIIKLIIWSWTNLHLRYFLVPGLRCELYLLRCNVSFQDPLFAAKTPALMMVLTSALNNDLNSETSNHPSTGWRRSWTWVRLTKIRKFRSSYPSAVPILPIFH